MTQRRNTLWGKGEDHLSNVGDAKKITCTRISPIERVKQGHYTISKRLL
jgi:hypothetical protein